MRGTRRSIAARFTLLAWAAVVAPYAVRAQTTTYAPPVAEPNIYPPALPPRKGPKPPALAFRLLGEISLPGPLPEGAPPKVVEGEIRIPVPSGVAVAPALPDSSVRLLPGPGEPDPASASDPGASPWVVSADGKLRVRALTVGRIEAQKQSRLARSGWRKAWSLRVAGATPAPPLLLERRVCYAALDDVVACVRSDNGHRIWATDVEDRVSRPMAVWEGEVLVPATKDTPGRVTKERLLLIVPDGGERLIALDSYDGSRRAIWELPPASGRLASPPVVTGDGKVVVTRQGYEAKEAAVALLTVSVDTRTAPKAAAAVPYNAPGPAGDGIPHSFWR